MRFRRSVVLRVVVTSAVLCFSAGRAIAQDKPTLSGSWSASGLSESWTFDNWVEACGPKPKASGAGGGSVQIREQGGELSIVGAGRAWSTSECWEQASGVARVSHSQSGGGRFWRTRCSGASDTHRITVTTTMQASDVAISMSEVAEHKMFPSRDVTCTAQATRSRSFSLVRRDGDESASPAASASASAAASASAPPVANDPPGPPSASAVDPANPKSPPKTCTSTAEPARLEVYPARKLLKPGERFSFRTVVVDAEGCSVSDKPSWSVSPGPLSSSITVDGSGNVVVAPDASEGRAEVVVMIGGKGVTVHVEVKTSAHYEALLTAGTIDPAEAEQGAVAIVATTAVGGRKGVADDVGRERKQLFVAIVLLFALGLGFVGLVILKRGRRGAAGIDVDDPAEDEGENALSEAAQDTIDDVAQVPAVETKPAAPGKVCPGCGTLYGAEAVYCGTDGMTLVPLNG